MVAQSEKQRPADPERCAPEDSQQQQHDHGQQASWDGPDDPANPYNWPSRRKVSVGIVCSASQLVTTMSAGMIAPAISQLLRDLGMQPATGQIALSSFFLGLGFAPFIVAPLSEMYGRKPVWLAGNVFYILWNSLCPVGFSSGLMIVGRLLSACGASVGVTVGTSFRTLPSRAHIRNVCMSDVLTSPMPQITGPVLADMYRSKDRGKSMAVAGVLPYIGPALGPVVGGLATQHLSWPWLFWILSIFDALATVVGFFVIHESYAPILLQRKARKAARALGAPQPTVADRISASARDFSSRVGPAIVKPLRLLVARPVIQFLALALSFEFGVYSLMLSTFATIFEQRYHQSPTTASLHYIAITLGAFLSAQGGGQLMDFIWRRMKAAHPDKVPTPEYRVPYFIVGLVPGIAGLFWYAWAAEKTLHWAVVDVAVCIYVCGVFMFSLGLLAYLLDEFPASHTASANAASRLTTYIFAFAFPIFAPRMYETLGIGWGNSLLAFILAALGISTIVILWFWGDKLRAKGRTPDEEKVVDE